MCKQWIPDDQFTLERAVVELLAPGSTPVDAADGLTYYKLDHDGWSFFLDPTGLDWYYEPDLGVEFSGPFATYRDAVQGIIDFEIEIAWDLYD